MIHILAGLKVCIHAMTPTQSSSALASTRARRIASASVSTGLATTRTGTSADASSAPEISPDWAATWSSTSGP